MCLCPEVGHSATGENHDIRTALERTVINYWMLVLFHRLSLKTGSKHSVLVVSVNMIRINS